MQPQKPTSIKILQRLFLIFASIYFLFALIYPSASEGFSGYYPPFREIIFNYLMAILLLVVSLGAIFYKPKTLMLSIFSLLIFGILSIKPWSLLNLIITQGALSVRWELVFLELLLIGISIYLLFKSFRIFRRV